MLMSSFVSLRPPNKSSWGLGALWTRPRARSHEDFGADPAMWPRGAPQRARKKAKQDAQAASNLQARTHRSPTPPLWTERQKSGRTLPLLRVKKLLGQEGRLHSKRFRNQ
eukprot:5266408-Pyramimonas_sp.AAC.1